MPDELQSLLEKIQKEGVEKARSEADRILSEARSRADSIIKEAEERAAAAVRKAEADSAAMVERGRRSLEQAARDVVISVGEAVQNVFQELARREVGKALGSDGLRQMLAQTVEVYMRSTQAGARLEIFLSPAQVEEVSEWLRGRFSEEIRRGIEIKADRGIASGFMVSAGDGKVRHDFTDAAIAESLCQLLRPQLAEIVRRSSAGLAGREAR